MPTMVEMVCFAPMREYAAWIEQHVHPLAGMPARDLDEAAIQKALREGRFSPTHAFRAAASPAGLR